MSTHTFRPIEYAEIMTATDNLAESSVIARGRFGSTVYAGNITLDDARLVRVAIKRPDPRLIRSLPEELFTWDVNTLSKLHHCNIVSSIGYCIHEEEKMVVYEYLPNGTLHDLLHNVHHNSVHHVSWLRRLQICLDVARGLDYLHRANFVHGDVRSSHILFNEFGVAKVGGLGLQKTCSWHSVYRRFQHFMIGDIFDSAYVDPVILGTGHISEASDVHAFGVLLLEVLYRKPVVLNGALYGEMVRNIVTWANVFIKQGNLKHITDPDIWAEITPECLKKFVGIAKRCVSYDIIERPTMADAIADLEEVLLLQEKFMNGSNFSWRERFRFLLPVRSCFRPQYLS